MADRLGDRPPYIVYGPLANATTGVIYEGAIDYPDKDRWARIAAKYRATIRTPRRPQSGR